MLASHLERHFSVRTLAEMLCLSEDTIIRQFENEPGVVKIDAGAKSKKVTLRVPESILVKKYQRWSK